MTRWLMLTLLAALLPAAEPAATQPAGGDEEAVRQMIASSVEAYNRGDARAVAEFYADKAEYVGTDGEVLRGRDAIRDALAQTFEEEKGARLEVRIDSIEIPRRNMAVVRGIGTVTPAAGEPASTSFRLVAVRQEGKWLIRNAQEIGEEGEALDQLGWLIGSWMDQDENVSIRTDCRWSPDRHFITRSFTASYRNGPELRGTEVIGWDPAARTIRSWVFDSDGTFGQSVWTHRGDEWITKSRGVLPDGSRASAVHIIRQIDPDRYTWESINREVDGEIMPDIKPVQIVRAETQPADSSSERQP